MELRPFAFPAQRAPPSVHPPDKMEIPTLSHLSEFSFRPVFQKSSNRIFSKKKIRHFVTFLEKVQSHQLSYVTLSVIFSFFFASSLSINEQNKRHQLFTVDALWITHYSLFTKLKFHSYFDNSFLYELSTHIAPKGAVIKIDITATVRTISPQDSPIASGTVPSAA